MIGAILSTIGGIATKALPFVPAIGKALDFIRGEKDYDAQVSNAQANQSFQKEFAQHGISWKVADAKRAGLHPLAALGSSTMSYNPVHIGQRRGPGYSEIGDSVLTGLAVQKARQELINMKLQNVGLAKDIGILSNDEQPIERGPFEGQVTARVKGTGPDIIEGQDPNIVVVPSEVKASNRLGAVAGVHPRGIFGIDTMGRAVYVSEQQFQESIESDVFEKIRTAVIKGNDFIQGNTTYYLPNLKKAVAWRQKLARSYRPDIPDKYKKTHEFRYDHRSGYFVLCKKKYPGDSRYYLNGLKAIGQNGRI